MGQKQQWVDDWSGQVQTSEREYTDAPFRVGVVDMETGLIVSDVRKFEEWMATVRTGAL